jgi:hypothetical protein
MACAVHFCRGFNGVELQGFTVNTDACVPLLLQIVLATFLWLPFLVGHQGGEDISFVPSGNCMILDRQYLVQGLEYVWDLRM